MKRPSRLAGFVTEVHHIDHVAPLCALINIPLFCTTPSIYTLIQTYYPDVALHLYTTEEILSACEAIITCFPRPIIDLLFYFDEYKVRKRLLTLWLPHGNSEKNDLQTLTKETFILAYGDQMIQKCRGLKAKILVVGHYRKHYTYKKYPVPEKPVLLYAPTWNGSDIKHDLPYILDHLPKKYHLLVKLHPNTTLHCEPRKQVDVIDSPPIFPLLEKASALITDTSSVAYDYLAFNRPIYLLGQTSPTPFPGYRTTKERLFHDLECPDSLDEERERLYQFVFSDKPRYATIVPTVEDYFAQELHF